MELKFQKYKDCFEKPKVCENSQSPDFNAFFEINKLKDQLQAKDIQIQLLKDQLDTSKRTTDNPKLKGVLGNSPTSSDTPKVLAPGMFAINTKYIPPPRRANWKAVDPTSRKKQVRFEEPITPSHKQTPQTEV